jgi:hypothetical protein
VYYAIFPDADENGDLVVLDYKKDHSERSFVLGVMFRDGSDTKPWLRPPQEPIQLTIDPDYETGPLPSFAREPVPVMSGKLLSVLRSSGVDNMDAYRAEIRYADGRLASTDHFVFNLLGVAKAADLAKSQYDSNQPDRLISMAFDSVTIDPGKARGLLMFRMAENITTIIVHERIKQAIAAAKIPFVRVLPVESIALL